ncbi:MAG: hypothetical protein V1798_02815 [Pseudomonadota bacterium]
MTGSLHETVGFKGVLFVMVLEFLFLGICAVLVGYGLSELKKGKPAARNVPIVVLGFVLAALSLYMTKLLLEG